MDIALLFNADHPTLGYSYGRPIQEEVLSTGVLQSHKRSMKISVGDVSTYGIASRRKSATIDTLVSVCRSTYVPVNLDRLIRPRLEATYGNATVYCLLFQNMTPVIAEELHTRLRDREHYLGLMDVDLSTPLHINLFRFSISEKYRVEGSRIAVLRNGFADPDDVDSEEKRLLESLGFEVEYENSGLRRTVFDNFDNQDHFKRVISFRSTFAKFASVSDDETRNIAYLLEDLNPKLLDSLCAAARTIDRAETEEDLAQAALSGRRFLETLADCLFPAQDETYNGRKVGPTQYKNRLWAYVEEAMSESSVTDPEVLSRLGGSIDSIIDGFNAGLHSGWTESSLERVFVSLVFWLIEVLEINPKTARDAIGPYFDSFDEFIRSIGHEENS